MSTRSSIKYEINDAGEGFHVFTDWLDDCAVEEQVVHLELRGVQFEADSSGCVHVVLPHAWAEKLGIVQPNAQGERRTE